MIKPIPAQPEGIPMSFKILRNLDSILELDFYPTRYIYLKIGSKDWVWERA